MKDIVKCVLDDFRLRSFFLERIIESLQETTAVFDVSGRLSHKKRRREFNKDVKLQSFLTDFAFRAQYFFLLFSSLFVLRRRPEIFSFKVTIIEEFD